MRMIVTCDGLPLDLTKLAGGVDCSILEKGKSGTMDGMALGLICFELNRIGFAGTPFKIVEDK